jgi:lipopolysaccharide export system protein LptA
MKKRCFLWALALMSAVTLNAPAQKHDSSGSGNSDPTGLGLNQKDRPKNAKTEITCQQESTFNNATNMATFVGTVVVKDPQFTLYCDKLTVYLNKEHKGIDHAEADGHVVIVQDNTDDKGKAQRSIGRSGHALFQPATGDVTLTIAPQLQQGMDNHVATETTTVMILNRAGRLKTVGGSKTTIVDADQQTAAPTATPTPQETPFGLQGL